MNSIFDFSNFGDALRDLVEKRKYIDPKFSFGVLADACQIQRSYLSQAINQKARLSADQVFAVTKYLTLKENESKYLLILNEIETTGIKARRDELEKERQKLQIGALKTENKIKRHTSEQSSEPFFKYYTNWAVPLVHMYLTIPRYLRNPDSIRAILALDENVFTDSLSTLEALNLISISTKGIKVLQDKLHLPSSSYFSKTNAISFRQKAIESLQKTKNSENHHFTATFSGTLETQIQLKRLFLTFVEEAAKVIEKSDNEDVFQINFDLFQI